MKVQETVKKETLHIAGGTLILTGVMLLVYALIGQMSLPVILGAIIGAAVGILDFFLLGLTVQSAAEMQATLPLQPIEHGEEGEEELPEPSEEQKKMSAKIRRRVQLSHTGRMLMIVAFAALGLLPAIDLVAILIPLLFPKLVIYAMNLLFKGRKGE